MKIEIKTLSYYIFLFFIMIYYGFRKTLIDYSVFNICMYLAIPFLIIKIMSESYTIKESIIILCLVILGVIETVKIGDTSILISVCAMIGMKKIDYKVPLKIVFWIRLVVTFIVLIFVKIGCIDNRVIVREGIRDEVRNSMGYAHPNTLGIYCFVLISLWILLYGKIRLTIKVFISLLITLLMYIETGSRTSVVILLLFLLLCVIFPKLSLSKLKKIGMCVIVGVALLNVLISVLYSNNLFLAKLNQVLSSRISLGASYYRVYGITLFGQSLPTVMNESSYWHLDSGWLNLLLGFGIVSFALYLFMSVILCKRTSDKNVIIILIAFSIYGFMEDVLSSMLYNYLWILFGAALFDKLDNQELLENLS